MIEEIKILILFMLYLSFLIFIIRYMVTSVKEGWNMVSVFLFFWLIQYLIIPLSMILNDSILFLDYTMLDLAVEPYGIERFYSYKSFAVIFIFINFFFLGVYSVKKEKIDEYKLKEKIVIIFSKEVNLLFAIGLFLAILSFASLFIYASQFGGMARAIEAADAVRSGHGDEYWISKTFIFVYRFIPFSTLVIIIFFLLDNRKGFWVWTMLWIGVGVSLFTRLALLKSKQSIIELFLLYLFYISLKNKKSYLLNFGLFFLSAIFLIPGLESYLDTGRFIIPDPMQFAQSTLDMLTFFNFNQTSLEFSVHNNYNFVYFEDFISGLRGTFIPISWLSNLDGNTLYTNTYFFYHERKAIVPPGVVAFGYYNFGVLGVIFIAFFSGVLVKKIEYFFNGVVSYAPQFIILYAFIMTKVFTWVRTGIPKFTFYDTLLVILSLVLYLGYKKERVIRGYFN